jgi:hypothetical protein
MFMYYVHIYKHFFVCIMLQCLFLRTLLPIMFLVMSRCWSIAHVIHVVFTISKMSSADNGDVPCQSFIVLVCAVQFGPK